MTRDKFWLYDIAYQLRSRFGAYNSAVYSLEWSIREVCEKHRNNYNRLATGRREPNMNPIRLGFQRGETIHGQFMNIVDILEETINR